MSAVRLVPQIYLQNFRDRTLVGVEGNIWSGSADVEDISFLMVNWGPTIIFYPRLSSGFFVKGGVSISDFGVGGRCGLVGGRLHRLPGFPPLAHADDPWQHVFGGCSGDTLGRGIGLVAGAGYDIPLAGWIALTTAVNVSYGHLDKLELAGEPLVDGWRQNVSMSPSASRSADRSSGRQPFAPPQLLVGTNQPQPEQEVRPQPALSP